MIVRELDARESNGRLIRLWWFEGIKELTVTVVGNGENFGIDCEPDKAWDVFNHPYAYRKEAA